MDTRSGSRHSFHALTFLDGGTLFKAKAIKFSGVNQPESGSKFDIKFDKSFSKLVDSAIFQCKNFV
jgi:hypothetical protein